MFMLLVFGRYVEEEGGVLGLWLTYLICGLGACFTATHNRLFFFTSVRVL